MFSQVFAASVSRSMMSRRVSVALCSQGRHHVGFLVLVGYGPAGNHQQIAAMVAGAPDTGLHAQALFLGGAAISLSWGSEHEYSAVPCPVFVRWVPAGYPMRGFAGQSQASNDE
jgi:hypothetical protein